MDGSSLNSRMHAGYFDELFYAYVTQKFAETDFLVRKYDDSIYPKPTRGSAGAQSAPDNAVGGATPGAKEDHQPGQPVKGTSVLSPQASAESPLERMTVTNRQRWGWCSSDRYCLGFPNAFQPLRPTLTNLLIGIIAAKQPFKEAQVTIDAMAGELSGQPQPGCVPGAWDEDPCADPAALKSFRSCIQQVDKQLHTFKKETVENCELGDRIDMNEQVLGGRQGALPLHCFRVQMKVTFGDPITKASVADPLTGLEPTVRSRTGLLRAAVADFLFNYKWAAQYPHDFIPYDLSQSAQELNAEFNPLVLAFNRDVSAFTVNLQDELKCKYDANFKPGASSWIKKGDETFINDGMLSVRGISGVESIVDTVTQSFFDATNPPSLTDLVKSVSDAEKNLPGVLKSNLSANEAAVLLGALNSIQPAQAKIGRELKLDITPHSLAGASSAELEVKLTAEEVGNPTRFTADKSAEDTLSRVATHDVTTRVRVESLKLFDVSAFSAMLQRPRSKFPIIPPFFEVPYFGSFIGWPLPGAKVYHRSTAVVSAVIVPTAADLAFGIDFGADRLCDGEGCYRANSPNDFGRLPLRNFHKAMVQCFASGGVFDYAGTDYQGRTLHPCYNAKGEPTGPKLFGPDFVEIAPEPVEQPRDLVPPKD